MLSQQGILTGSEEQALRTALNQLDREQIARARYDLLIHPTFDPA